MKKFNFNKKSTHKDKDFLNKIIYKEIKIIIHQQFL